MFVMPLKQMKLRTKNLESAYGASFGRVRKWDPAHHQHTVFHQGWDLEAPVGTACYAISGGTISHIGHHVEFGNYIDLLFSRSGRQGTSPVDPLWAFYAHLSQVLVLQGQVVSCGQLIGLTGCTGNASASAPHLHFEIRNTSVASPGLGDAGRLDPASVLGYHFLVCS
jgi:murein DD-endopeptidase MepM/ murein hydrolase activator NlpD